MRGFCKMKTSGNLTARGFCKSLVSTILILTLFTIFCLCSCQSLAKGSEQSNAQDSEQASAVLLPDNADKTNAEQANADKTNAEQTNAAPIEPTKEEVKMSTVKISGNEMQYIVFGHGEKTFVILPGLSIHSVMGLADAVSESYKDFATEYTVYLFDRPTSLEEGYTIKDLARDTALAMKALGIKNADIFGASQGGMISLCLVIYYPELCNKVILGSTLSRTNDTFVEVVKEWIELAKEQNEDKLLENFIERVYSKDTVEKYKNVLIESNKGITNEEYERFIILASSCLNFNVYDDLKNIKAQVLVLGCEGDNVVTCDGSLEIANSIDCETYIYPAIYGHGVYDEAPDYKTRMLEFLNADLLSQ